MTLKEKPSSVGFEFEREKTHYPESYSAKFLVAHYYFVTIDNCRCTFYGN